MRWPVFRITALHAAQATVTSWPRQQVRSWFTWTLARSMNKTKYVVINDRLSSIEARVVAGHEAGHIIRHATELKVGAFQDNDIYMATGKKEREANVFAADFLIRDADVLELMQSCDSNFFNVSKALRIPAPFFAFKLYSMVERGHAMRMPVDLDSTFLARKRC